MFVLTKPLCPLVGLVPTLGPQHPHTTLSMLGQGLWGQGALSGHCAT